MEIINLNSITVSSIRTIFNDKGSIFHILKVYEKDFKGFGEAYFSFIKYDLIKAWKKHDQMFMNLVVPIGKVKFVFFDNHKNFREEIIGEENYVRLTVPPKIWFGFKGLEKKNLILNIANLETSENEIQRKNLSEIVYDW